MRISTTKPEFWIAEPRLIYDARVLTSGPELQRRFPSEIYREYIYVLLDAQREPLYVGRTCAPRYRFARHRRRVWWPDVHALSMYMLERLPGAKPPRYRDGRDVLDAAKWYEARFIAEYRPRHNVTGNPLAVNV